MGKLGKKVLSGIRERFSMQYTTNLNTVNVQIFENRQKKQTLWPLFMDGVQLPQG